MPEGGQDSDLVKWLECHFDLTAKRGLFDGDEDED